MDRNYVLYQDDKGVRNIVKLPVDERISVIGFSRYSVLLHGSEGDGDHELNGAYPIIKDEHFNDLFGKVLTVVDASFLEGAQKEAFKTLIKGSISEWYAKHCDYNLKMTDKLVKTTK